MTTAQLETVQDDYSGGMNRDVARHLIPQNGAYDILNAFLIDDGSAQRRGGPSYLSNAGLGSAGLTWLHDAYFDAGRRTIFANASDFGVLDSNDATPLNLGAAGLPYAKGSAMLNSLLFIGGGFIYGGSRMIANYTTGTITLTNGSKTVTGSGTTWNTLVDAGMLLQRGNERVYPIASVDSTTQVTLRDPYEGSSGSGISYTLSPIYTITTADPYETADFYAVSNKRLVWMFNDRLRFSEIEKPHSWTNRYGTANEHTIPECVIGTGLGIVGQNTLIFTTGGLWVLNGLALDIIDAAGNPNHRLAPITRDRILWGPAGIASWDQLLIAPCEDGVYLVDGVSGPVELSRSIGPYYRSYVEGGYRPGRAAVHRAHYFLPIVTTSSNKVVDVLVCRLDRAALDRRRRTTFPWIRLNGFGGRVSAYASRVDDAQRESMLLGASADAGSRLLNLGAYFEPDAAHKLDPDGSHFSDWVITRDFPTGNGTINGVRKVRVRRELVDAANDDPVHYLDYGDGSTPPGLPRWGDPAGKWGTGFGPLGTSPWTAGGDFDFTTATFDGAADAAPENDGRDPHTFRINKKMRFIRLRSRCDSPTARSVLRSIEIFVRESGAVRR